MIAFLAVPALLLAQASDSVRARGPVATASVGVEAAGLRVEPLLSAVGGSAQRLANGHWLLALAGHAIELVEGVPYARLGDRYVSIAGAPSRARDGSLLVPVQVVAEFLPALGTGISFDARSRELRVGIAPTSRAGTSASAPVVSRAAVPSQPAPRPPSRPSAGSARRRTVVIDAGHGGRDPGMRGWDPARTPVREKDITLGVALALEEELRRDGLDIVMTRRTDTLIALDDRGRIANRRGGDLFVSIHVNAANPGWRDPTGARGFETYFLAEAKTEDERRVARMENEAVQFETQVAAPKDDPLGFIINDMAQNEHLRESSDLALTIQQALRGAHPGPSRGVRQAGFRVLVTAFMPAVLVEVGFGTNPAEAAWMNSADGQRSIARAVATGVREYLAHYERRLGTGGQR